MGCSGFIEFWGKYVNNYAARKMVKNGYSDEISKAQLLHGVKITASNLFDSYQLFQVIEIKRRIR